MLLRADCVMMLYVPQYRWNKAKAISAEILEEPGRKEEKNIVCIICTICIICIIGIVCIICVICIINLLPRERWNDLSIFKG